jgi:hypothetical protein
MAKRTAPDRANDTAAPSSPRAGTRRVPVNTTPEADTIAAYPGVERSEDDGAVAQAAGETSRQEFHSPSDQEIRERAYHRYLERGGHGGSEFDDWVEAERDLRNRR